MALAGVLAARLRRPRLAVAAYGVLALAIAWFTFQTLMVLTPLMCDQAAGEYVRRVASPQDLLIMGPIEEFEYGASLEYYARRHILMVKRHGLPQFPYPVPPASDYIITPERLQELWQGPRKVFLLLDDATPPEPFLQGRPGGPDPAGQAPAGQPSLRLWPRPPPRPGLDPGRALIHPKLKPARMPALPFSKFLRRQADLSTTSLDFVRSWDNNQITPYSCFFLGPENLYFKARLRYNLGKHRGRGKGRQGPVTGSRGPSTAPGRWISQCGFS